MCSYTIPDFPKRMRKIDIKASLRYAKIKLQIKLKVYFNHM